MYTAHKKRENYKVQKQYMYYVDSKYICVIKELYS